MLRRTSILILAVMLLPAAGCAPRQAVDHFASTVTSELAPIAQQALDALASAAVSPPVDGASTPSGSPRSARIAPKSAPPPSIAAVPIALDGVPLSLTQTAHEDIYAASGVAKAFLQSVIADAGLAAQGLMRDEGWSGAPHVVIFVFPSRDAWLQGIGQIGQLPQSQIQFQAQLKGDAWVTISGTAHPGIYIYPIQQSSFDMLHMLAHEYTHAIQRQVITDSTVVPDWFIEGMAEAEGWRIAGQTNARAYAQTHDETVVFVRAAQRQHRMIPLMNISTQQSWEAHMESPRGATLEYAEGQLAIESLQQLKGANAPMNILRATVALGSFTAAFQQTTQMSMPQFQAAFESSLK